MPTSPFFLFLEHVLNRMSGKEVVLKGGMTTPGDGDHMERKAEVYVHDKVAGIMRNMISVYKSIRA